MMYSVIYTLDAPRGLNLRPYVPPRCKELWDCTEDGVGEYAYLDDEMSDAGKRWANGPHRKWCAILTEDQFREFLEHTGLFPEDVETMGSIGAPGYGWGWAPAVSFRNDDPETFQSAYVTPGGTRREVREFLAANGRDVPACLTDSVNQRYLFPDDEAGGDSWAAVKDVVLELFAA